MQYVIPITYHCTKTERRMDMGFFNKKELDKIDELEKQLAVLQAQLSSANSMLAQLKGKEISDIDQMIANKKEVCTRLDGEIKAKKQMIVPLDTKIADLDIAISEKTRTLNDINDDIEVSEFGLYKPHYHCLNSGQYAEKIKAVRAKQKEMIKNRTALNFFDHWTLSGSEEEGRKMNNDNMKLYLRAYNNECDNQIAKVKYNNIERIEQKIVKIGEQLDKLNVRNKISVTHQYARLKIDELHLCYEYEQMKQDEKEKLREERAQAREEAKLQAEIKAAKKKITKDLTQFNNALQELISKADTIKPEELSAWKSQVTDLQTKIADKNKEMDDVDYREANAKAGYVYIISNIGAFGKDVYKIGMTRRLEPLERIEELSSASVPFKFDVHAMIFSDDAPHLETLLHNAFDQNKVNLMNPRKEFFKVPLSDIEKIVHEQFDPLVTFKKEPEAEQYRESEKIREIKHMQ